MGWTIRPTLAPDRPAVLALVEEAFTGKGPDGRQHDGREEADIVAHTWELGIAPAELDLVAVEDDGRLIGHVLAAPGVLRGRQGEDDGEARVDRRALAVAPLAVLPSRQRRGVGSSLMREVLSRAEASGAPLVLLLGDPAYYGRFRFEPAGSWGIFYPPAGPEDPHFMVRRFRQLGEEWRGAFVYCWENAAGS